MEEFDCLDGNRVRSEYEMKLLEWFWYEKAALRTACCKAAQKRSTPLTSGTVSSTPRFYPTVAL